MDPGVFGRSHLKRITARPLAVPKTKASCVLKLILKKLEIFEELETNISKSIHEGGGM